MTTRFIYSRRATPAEAAAIRAKRAAKHAALADESKALIAEQVAALPKAADGAPGNDGFNGWSPLFGVVDDGDRSVLELVDWSGGTGAKPDVRGYVGADGIVRDIADATDIKGVPGERGARGATGADGASILTGSRDPKATEGKDGDFYLNVKTSDLFEKTAGAWNRITNIRGERGQRGPAGAAGAQGQRGADGFDARAAIIMDFGPPPSGGVVGQAILCGDGPPT